MIVRLFYLPDDVTAVPRTLPPPIRNNVCQERELKSTSVRMPVPNIKNTKVSDIIPMSPMSAVV